MKTVTDTRTHETSCHGEITDVVNAVVYNEENSELTIFAVNRNLSEAQELTVDVRSFGELCVLEKLVLVNGDLKAENSLTEEKVRPEADTDVSLEGGILRTVLKEASWNVIRQRLADA